MNIKLIVATHKRYRMPNDDIYLPLHVGKEGKESIGIEGDNTGENISEKNFYFNEMTAVYWAWKNCNYDYIGLCHYRRFFSNCSFLKRILCRDKYKLLITKSEIEKLIGEENYILLPTKRKYYIETIESHFRHLPYTINGDLDALRNVLTNDYPDYLEGFELVMKRTWAHMFNMFCMSKVKFDEYASWAFEVLFKVDQMISMKGRTPIQARMYVSEFLMDTWIETNRYKYKEIPILFMENEHWIKKIMLFVLRKIRMNY